MSKGKTHRFRQFEFYAERGMITLIDTNLAADDDCDPHDAIKRISPGEFMKRAIAAMMAEPDLYPSKQQELRKLVDDAKEACLLAKRQGDPTDPKVMDYAIRHREKKATLILPGDIPGFGGPLKIKPRGETAADALSKGVDVVPDLTL